MIIRLFYFKNLILIKVLSFFYILLLAVVLQRNGVFFFNLKILIKYIAMKLNFYACKFFK